MARDEAYYQAEKKIEEALKSGATELDLRPSFGFHDELDLEYKFALKDLPKSLKKLSGLEVLIVRENNLTKIPEWIGDLKQLRLLDLASNEIQSLPNSLENLSQLQLLDLSNNLLTNLPEGIGKLTQLQSLSLYGNRLVSLPESLGKLQELQILDLSSNRLEVFLENISKLERLQMLLISNNQLRDLPTPLADLVRSGNFQIEHDNFRARNYYQTRFMYPDEEDNWTENEIDEEGEESDFLGTESYNNYYSVQMGQMRLWGTLCINDNPFNPELAEAYEQGAKGILAYLRAKAAAQITLQEAKLILVGEGEVGKTCLMDALLDKPWKEHETTHGIEIQSFKVINSETQKEITLNGWDFGGQRVYRPTHQLFFSAPAVYLVVWKPREGTQQGFVKDWIQLVKRREPTAKILVVATHGGPGQRQPDIDRQELWDLFGKNSVVDFFFVDSKPDKKGKRKGIAELKETIARVAAALPEVGRSVPKSFAEVRIALQATGAPYLPFDEVLAICRARNMDDEIARLFITIFHRLGHLTHYENDPISLIAQLVPDVRPEISGAWSSTPATGDTQQTQICRVVDKQTRQSATAEGLFYQLIVRLHKYSLGRVNYNDSVHWQRGIVLEDEYKNRAFLEHIGNDVRITVRSPYPEGLLGMLTREVKFLVESFWEGLNCEVTVPCLNPIPCQGLFEVSKLIESKREGQPKYPCPICNNWQNIDTLLRNAPDAAQPISLDVLIKEFAQVKDKLDVVNENTRRILSQVDKQYVDLIQLFTDEAKEGPRLFSLFPLDGSKFNPKDWIRHQFRLVLWCEHSRLPLPVLNNGDMKKGVYDFKLDKEWFKKTAPYLKLVTGTLSLVLPVASSALQVANDAATKALQDQIGLGKDVIDAIIGEGAVLNEFSSVIDSANLERGVGSRAENATLRELHALLKAKDPGFGGLVRVLNKRNEFLWVHEKFAGEY